MEAKHSSHLVFRKSSFSGEAGGECVEVAVGGEVIVVRDPKDPGGRALVFTGAEWRAFPRDVKANEFDLR